MCQTYQEAVQTNCGCLRRQLQPDPHLIAKRQQISAQRLAFIAEHTKLYRAVLVASLDQLDASHYPPTQPPKVQPPDFPLKVVAATKGSE